MTTGLEGQVFTIDVFEVGSDLTKVRSFHIKPWGQGYKAESFSPTTYRISISTLGRLYIVDLWNSEWLLVAQQTGFKTHCFSSDGNLYAASSESSVHIWKHNSSRYTPWRVFPIRDWISFGRSTLQFSPTSPLILGIFQGRLQVFHLDGPPIIAHPRSTVRLAVLSPCGTYMATARELGRTVTITNLHSQTASQFIDTSAEIRMLLFTGNILIVLGKEVLTAWRLTDEGLVDGIFGDKRAGHGDGIWAVSVFGHPVFTVEDKTVLIEDGQNVVHVYHTGTGEVLEATRTPQDSRVHQYTDWRMGAGGHYPHYHGLVEQGAFQGIRSEDVWPVSKLTLLEGWVEDCEGRRRLWIPMEWRLPQPNSGWHSNIATLWLHISGEPVIIMF